MGWILYTHCLLVLSIQWIFRNRILDLLCMPMHRIGSFHFSLTCYSFYYSCILYPSSALVFFPHRRFPASLVSIPFSPYLSFLSALLYRSKHLACFLHLLCWILFVFVHWIFDCFVSVAILWIKPLISSPVYNGVLLLAQAAKPPAAMEPPNIFS